MSHTPDKPLRIGLVGTGAIAHKHAQAYANIGYRVVACYNQNFDKGEAFAQQYGARNAESLEAICADPEVDVIDLCTFPDVRLEPLRLAANAGKHVQVQKPIATNLKTARDMIEYAHAKRVLLAVVSQHRFDDSIIFLKQAIADGRLGKILQADAYVKWWRSEEYYSRPIKGSWDVEGGGALINQGIHQVDMLLHLLGPVKELYGMWQLGARHKIASEDVVQTMLRYANGAQGVIQASTAFWPGYTERLEIHGTKGTAVISGDKLTTWDVQPGDSGEPAPLASTVASGASDPMAISLTPFERQFADLGRAIATGTAPSITGEDGYRALELVLATYQSCREGKPVTLGAAH
ncbi:MAG: Gfo/Idh/MocA family oxidoreductase [Bryobacteraceae bacterium]|nr:Gfo/Idh/MocA family oxidoreductase [Bryobacteraceae bacterium]